MSEETFKTLRIIHIHIIEYKKDLAKIVTPDGTYIWGCSTISRAILYLSKYDSEPANSNRVALTKVFNILVQNSKKCTTTN
jgi:hypothetical protein